MALGAHPARISASVVGGGVRLALLGGAVGIVAALAFGRSLESMLYGVSTTDPAALVAMAGLFIAIAALASWLPARRAARVDPMSALRAD
jgi:ABC-type antimicrobial peptide transport system permease subunit